MFNKVRVAGITIGGSLGSFSCPVKKCQIFQLNLYLAADHLWLCQKMFICKTKYQCFWSDLFLFVCCFMMLSTEFKSYRFQQNLSPITMFPDPWVIVAMLSMKTLASRRGRKLTLSLIQQICSRQLWTYFVKMKWITYD